jgi:hypothetical protein
VPGRPDDQLGSEAISEAARLRAKAAVCLEQAANSDDPRTRKAYERAGQAYEQLATMREFVEQVLLAPSSDAQITMQVEDLAGAPVTSPKKRRRARSRRRQLRKPKRH